jgi:3-oxoacyl-(acyl-carrier-protein) synthase
MMCLPLLGIVPPTLNLDTVDPMLEGGEVFSHVPEKAVVYKVRVDIVTPVMFQY